MGPELLSQKDNNGWNTLHEAARGGHGDVVKYLIEERKLNKDERTHRTGSGGSPLWWAKDSLPAGHEVIEYLESIGAKNIMPEGHSKKKKDKKGEKKDKN